MDDAANAVLAHDAEQRVAIGDVAAHERHPRGDFVAGDHAQPPRILAQVVGDRPLVLGQQPANHPRADAAERAGHEGRHGR
jgi:hypothetical protein